MLLNRLILYFLSVRMPGSVYQPVLPNITFYATQAFTYAPKNLKAVDENKTLDIERLRERAIYHCNRVSSILLIEHLLLSSCNRQNRDKSNLLAKRFQNFLRRFSINMGWHYLQMQIFNPDLLKNFLF